MYYNFNKLLSYGDAYLYFVIGERGVGKTYGAKDYCINHYKKKKKKFVWIRRYGTDLEDAIGSSEDNKFFNPMKKKYNDKFDIQINKKTYNLIMNNKSIGYAMSLRMAESLKGTEYDDVDTIIFDEFLVGDGGSRYIKNEPMYLLSIIDTVARLRKIRVILLGNATSVFNPYFDFFKIHLPYNSEYQTFKEGTIVVNYIKNLEYREARKQSDFGKLVAGTDYERYAIDNQFINDSNDFIRYKSKESKLFCNIIINNEMFGVWLDNTNMYISRKYNANFNINITFDYHSHNEKTLLVKSKNVFMTNIIKHFQLGRLFFENQKTKHLIIELLKRTGRIY